MSNNISVLIVDDKPRHLDIIKTMLEEYYLERNDNVSIQVSSDAYIVAKDINQGKFEHDIIISDVFMPDEHGEITDSGGAYVIYMALSKARADNRYKDIFLMSITNMRNNLSSIWNNIEIEQKKLKEELWTFIFVKSEEFRERQSDDKLFDNELWKYIVTQAIQKHEEKQWKRTFISETIYEHIHSITWCECLVKAEKFAKKEAILITGEAGLGQILIANAIHKISGRTGRFIPVDVKKYPLQIDVMYSEIVEDRNRQSIFYEYRDGTVLLDKIDHNETLGMTLDNFLTERKFRDGSKFNGCVIFSASTLDMVPKVLKNKVRGCIINIKPLNERKDEITELINVIISRLVAEKYQDRRPLQLNSEVMELFKKYDYPLNVSELVEMIDILYLHKMTSSITYEDVCKYLPRLCNYSSSESTNGIAQPIRYPRHPDQLPTTADEVWDLFERSVKAKPIEYVRLWFLGHNNSEEYSHTKRLTYVQRQNGIHSYKVYLNKLIPEMSKIISDNNLIPDLINHNAGNSPKPNISRTT